MKIAITADLHLTSQESNPDRFQALSDILQQCNKNGIEKLIVAGDLFDKEFKNIADFESAYRDHASDSLFTYIIPGNHDKELSSSAITIDNVQVIEKTTLLNFDEQISFLLVPFIDKITMGEEISKFMNQLEPEHWILIGHGDWIGGIRSVDPYEKGIYMPLINSDVVTYKPLKVILGHIHLPIDSDRIYYVGSPCPIKINETGQRRYAIFDTKMNNIMFNYVNCPWISYIEQFIVLPIEDELIYLNDDIEKRILSWNLPKPIQQEVKIRVSVKGFTSNRVDVAKLVKDKFKNFNFIDIEGPLLDELYQSNDPERALITQKVKKWIEELDWNKSELEPTKDDIFFESVKSIYKD